MKTLLLALVMSLCALTASAQQLLNSGPLTTNGDSLSASLRQSTSSITFQVIGTWTGTITFQGSVDGVTFVSLLVGNASNTATATTTTASGLFVITNSGFSVVRATATAAMTGRAMVAIMEGYGSGGGGGGGGGGSGGTTTDPDDASIAAAQTNDNVNALTMAYDGTVWRRITFYANDATAAGTTFLPVLPGLVETSAPTRTNGRMAGLSFLAGGGARVVVVDAAGAALSLATDATHDSPKSATGPQAMLVASAFGTLPTAVSAADDAVRATADLQGVAYTRSATDPCSGVAKTFIPINISTAATTEITAALAGASTYYYVCSLNLVTAGANNIALVDDDSDGCGTVTSGLAGGTTAASGWNLSANSGIAVGNGLGAIFKTNGTNRVVCLVTSAATQLSGTMTVVAAP